MKNTQGPYLARQLSVFSPRGSHQRVNLCACSLSHMVMQEDTSIYPGSGKRRPYVQRGGESLYYLAPKLLYRGKYKRGMECGVLLRMSVVSLCSIPESLLL